MSTVVRKEVDEIFDSQRRKCLHELQLFETHFSHLGEPVKLNAQLSNNPWGLTPITEFYENKSKRRTNQPVIIYESNLGENSNSHDYYNYPKPLLYAGSIYRNPSVIQVNIQSDPVENITKLIAASRYILDLKEGWDDHNALKITPYAFYLATGFLKNYAKYIYEWFHLVLTEPEINPCRDGSIDLSWRTAEARMLINFTDGQEPRASFYGDHTNRKNDIEGSVNPLELKEYLAVWMKVLAKRP